MYKSGDTTINTPYTPSELITHRDLMLLLDEVSAYGEDWIECRVHHRRGCAFSNSAGRTPTWVGLEYMCQTIAALAGIQRLAAGRGITTGFVIGSRSFSVATPYFERQQLIKIHATEEMKNESSLGVYACKISDENGRMLAEAKVKAVMPEDPNSIINFRR